MILCYLHLIEFFSEREIRSKMQLLFSSQNSNNLLFIQKRQHVIALILMTYFALVSSVLALVPTLLA